MLVRQEREPIAYATILSIFLRGQPQSFRVPEVRLLIVLVPGFGLGVCLLPAGGCVVLPGVPGCAPAPTAPGRCSFRV